MFYFIFINENCIAVFDTRDDFKHPIKEGQHNIYTINTKESVFFFHKWTLERLIVYF